MAFYNEQGTQVLAILWNGVLVSDDVGSINFTGAGVTVSVTGDEITVNIPGGGSATNVIFGEVVSGSGTAWTIANVPNGTISLEANGQTLSINQGDYTITGANITTTLSWPSGSLQASYKY